MPYIHYCISILSSIQDNAYSRKQQPYVRILVFQIHPNSLVSWCIILNDITFQHHILTNTYNFRILTLEQFSSSRRLTSPYLYQASDSYHPLWNGRLQPQHFTYILGFSDSTVTDSKINAVTHKNIVSSRYN
jgi:hypothetical protein